jgi:hypothetical protein
VQTGLRFAHEYQSAICIRLYNKIVNAKTGSHTKLREWSCSQEQDKANSDTENIRALNLEVKLITVQVTKLPL